MNLLSQTTAGNEEMATQNISIGTGNPFTPCLFNGLKTRVPVRLSKTNPLYEGPHEPFFINASDLDSEQFGDIDIAVRYTGHHGKNGAPLTR
jgi:hypothetical protein